ncbi:hypothetical protein GW17_00045131 [Ensete ventricosum]|nr:hypothetical protein GW17_00045131 [Ensete ventricosum]
MGSVFHALSRKFKILAIPNVCHGKSYGHGFMKKRDGHKLCKKSRVKLSFDRFFRAPSWQLKILVIHYILAHGKLYEHGFMKKCIGHQLCTKPRVKSSFDRFFVHHLENSKYWPFTTY